MNARALLARHGLGWATWLIRVLLGPLCLLILASGTTEAHAVVTGTDPLDGALLEAPPAEISVQFSEPVALTRAQILDPSGQDILAPEAARAENERLFLPLPVSLAEGTYTVSYHVVSLDGHPVAGSLVFSVGQVSASGSDTHDMDHSRVWHRSFVAARALLYLALFGAAGGVLYTRLVRPGEASLRGNRRIIVSSAILGLAAAVAALGLQGGMLTGGSWVILRNPATWAMGAQSAFGRTALCAMAGLLLIWVGSQAGRAPGSGSLVLIGAVLVLGSFALSGHVVTAGPRGLTTPPLLIHAVVAAFWVGSLIPLHRALTLPAAEAHRSVERFSRVAIWAVPVLIAAGLVMACLQVRTPEALVATVYGRVLLIKLGLVAGLLGLAALNRFRLTPALARSDKGAAARLGGSILAEAGLAVAILVATATLGTTPPPRALAASASAEASDTHAHMEHGHGHPLLPLNLRLSGEGFEATVNLDQGQHGASAASISLLDAEGQPTDVLEVALRLSSPERGIAPLERPAQRDSVGHWIVPDLVLAVEGTWEVELDVLVSDFERQTLRGTVSLN